MSEQVVYSKKILLRLVLAYGAIIAVALYGYLIHGYKELLITISTFLLCLVGTHFWRKSKGVPAEKLRLAAPNRFFLMSFSVNLFIYHIHPFGKLDSAEDTAVTSVCAVAMAVTYMWIRDELGPIDLGRLIPLRKNQ